MSAVSRTALLAVRGPVAETAGMIRFARRTFVATGRSIAEGRFPLAEAVVQTWYAVKVCTLPALAVSVPFGIILALQVGVLAQEVGAVAFTGAGNTLAVVRQASPIITALMLSGVAGSAVCADLGARRIREEIDALEVMGLSVLERLVVPRMFAIVAVALLLNGVVMFFTIMTTLLVSVTVQNLPPGSYLASVTTLAQMSDLVLSLVKAGVFAVICAIVASYKGLGAQRGPTGVGEAVTSAVVTNFVMLFAANFVISQVQSSLGGGMLG
jgi:phospholipid/cholesterol/gamma-HCH transport system permease protein